MPTLNRFPLLALWAKEAARRLGYTVAESEALGHAYAVLYAIRAGGKSYKKEKAPAAAGKRAAAALPPAQIEFGGDKINVAYDANGKVRGLVGNEDPQTSQTYRKHVLHKYPPGYYDKLQESFRELFKLYRPGELNSRLLYDLYDNWKKSCGAGRLVDLDKLVKWCEDRAAARP
jgi:hypothetical protein